jgi:hypothetical protein
MSFHGSYPRTTAIRAIRRERAESIASSSHMTLHNAAHKQLDPSDQGSEAHR